MKFNYPIQTRYSETAQDGIIHHSTYVVYLENARIAYLKNLGIDINAMEKRKIFCPVVDLSLKFLKTLQSLDDISVNVILETCSKVRFSFNYEILKEGNCVTEGATVHCFVNEHFKPIPIPHEVLEKLKSPGAHLA
jgi:acyl-CoA thioester hydrolase